MHNNSCATNCVTLQQTPPCVHDIGFDPAGNPLVAHASDVTHDKHGKGTNIRSCFMTVTPNSTSAAG